MMILLSLQGCIMLTCVSSLHCCVSEGDASGDAALYAHAACTACSIACITLIVCA